MRIAFSVRPGDSRSQALLAGTVAAMAYAVLMHRAYGHDQQAPALEHGDRSVFDLKSTILLTLAALGQTAHHGAGNPDFIHHQRSVQGGGVRGGW